MQKQKGKKEGQEEREEIWAERSGEGGVKYCRPCRLARQVQAATYLPYPLSLLAAGADS